MIDRDWFELVLCFSGANVAAEDIDRLCIELGDESELLPYLLVNCAAFKDWSQASAALRQSVRSIIRPRTTAHKAPNALTGADRQQVRNAILADLTAACDIADEQEAPSRAAQLKMQHMSSSHNADPTNPRWFILQ